MGSRSPVAAASEAATSAVREQENRLRIAAANATAQPGSPAAIAGDGTKTPQTASLSAVEASQGLLRRADALAKARLRVGINAGSPYGTGLAIGPS